MLGVFIQVLKEKLHEFVLVGSLPLDLVAVLLPDVDLILETQNFSRQENDLLLHLGLLFLEQGILILEVIEFLVALLQDQSDLMRVALRLQFLLLLLHESRQLLAFD